MKIVTFASPLFAGQFSDFNSFYVDAERRAGRTGLLDYSVVKRHDRILSLTFKSDDAAQACAEFFTPKVLQGSEG